MNYSNGEVFVPCIYMYIYWDDISPLINGWFCTIIRKLNKNAILICTEEVEESIDVSNGNIYIYIYKV